MIKNVLTWLCFAFLSACTDDGTCTKTSDCPPGSVCLASECRVACNAETTCPNGQGCRNGVCVAVECVPGVRCDDGDPCTTADECDVYGECVGLAVVCDRIPAAECLDANNRRTFSTGHCDAGECVYPQRDFPCPGCPSCSPSCNIGGEFVSAGVANPANGCQYCDPYAATTAWTSYTCEVGTTTDPCLTDLGTCDPALNSGDCQGADCCAVTPSWPVGSVEPAPACPLSEEDTDNDGVRDNDEIWTGSCTHDGECGGCSSSEHCDDGDECSVDTCNEPLCAYDWEARVGQACTVHALNDGRCVEVGSRAECKLVNGEACDVGNPSACAEGWCADDVCCNEGCLETCRTCSNEDGGTAGTCHDTAAGSDPDDECSASDGACAGADCDGAGACEVLAGKQSCSVCHECDGSNVDCQPASDITDNDCNSLGMCASTACADGACQALSGKHDCGPCFACDGSAYDCQDILTADADCRDEGPCASTTCVSGVCQPVGAGKESCDTCYACDGENLDCRFEELGNDPADECPSYRGCDGEGTCSVWTNLYGTDKPDTARGMAADSEGNVFVVGEWDSNPSYTGSEDFSVVGFDASGMFQWNDRFGSTSVDDATGIATYGSDIVYVTGWTFADLSGGFHNTGRDYVLAKYDGGVRQWAIQSKADSLDHANAVATDGAGGVYVTGYTYGEIGGANAGLKDVLVVKYNAAGTLLWSQQLGTTGHDLGHAVATDAANNVYVGAGFDGAQAVVKLAGSNGAEMWTETLEDGAVAGSVAIDGSGNIIVAANSSGLLTGNPNSPNNPYDTDSHITKYSSDRVLQWTRQFGSWSGDQSLNAVAVDGVGGIYVVGETDGYLPDFTNQGSDDYFVVKYDTHGNHQWSQQIGSETTDVAVGVATYEEAPGVFVVYVGGYTRADLDGNPNAGNYDFFVVRMTSDGVKQ